MRIACLHTAPSNVDVFERAAHGLDVTLHHEVRADFLDAVAQTGSMTRETGAGVAEVLTRLGADADAVLLTCSTIGAVVDLVSSPAPVLRVDAALARAALVTGAPVVALCTAATSLEPTRALFEQVADGAVPVEVRLVPGAWAVFQTRQHDAYFAAIAKAVREARAAGPGVVALAQASMAPAAVLCPEPRPRTSPAAGLIAAMDAARDGTAPW